jgi:hypothetical protein
VEQATATTAGVAAAGVASRGAAAGVGTAAAVTTATEQTTTVATAAIVLLAAATIAMEQATAAAAAAATMTTETGNSRALLTADEGDADHREEHRDAKHKCTIHSELLQTVTNKQVRTFRGNPSRPTSRSPRLRRQQERANST